jgi:hypothetical protein
MNITRLISLWLVTSMLVTGGGVAAQEPSFDYPPSLSLEEVRTWVDRIEASHPRLLATRSELDDLRNSLDADPLRRQVAQTIVRQARLMQSLAPVERKLEGRRLLGVSRNCVQRVLTMAMAYHLTGDDAHVQRCQREMLAAARFDDWNPSHFLDVAEMTFALAIGYDWLHDQLDNPSREEIRTAIIEKGVCLPFTTRHRGWVRSRNNWGQVCHGGLTAGALAVAEHDPDLAARTVHNALHNVTRSMAAFAPKGSYPEGPGYWSYGTSYNVILIAVLESALGTDFGLTKAPGFDMTGQYLGLVTGPCGATFNYADGGSRRSPQPILFWFAERYDRPDWLLGERERWHEGLAEMNRRRRATSGGRLAPLVLLWMPQQHAEPKIRMPLSWYSEDETPITIHRTSWTDPNATFLGLKAGSPSANHGQMDLGSFVLDSDGVRWAMDLGAEGYHGIESRGMDLWNRAQDSDRWKIFRQRNHGHNTLVIDDQLQRAAGSGEIVAFSDDGEASHAVVDMSSVYQGQAQRVQRGVRLMRSGEVLIQDQLVGAKPGSRVRWGMITPASHSALDQPNVELKQEAARLKLGIVAPRNAAWMAINTSRPGNEWDSPNPGTVMIAFESVVPESGDLTLAVLATPGSCASSTRDQLQLQPLDNWRR